MKGSIYLIRNLINGKGYVGQTLLSVDDRFARHKQNARWGIDFVIYRSMRKHGIENFVVEEITNCDAIFLNALEKFCIIFYGTFGCNGYNMTEGGDSRRPKGWRHSEEWKANNSLIHRGMKRPPRSEEWKQKQRARKLGKSPSLETRKKLSFACRGKAHGPMSEEHKAKVSASKKGKGQPWSPARWAAHRRLS